MKPSEKKDIIIPAPLEPGDKVVFASPSGTVKAENVEIAAEILREFGWEVEIAPHALGKYNTYSGTPEQRFADLRNALLDPQVKAIICSRGGYGAVHILDELDKLPLRENAKWIVGFSDISALHALMARHGIVSVHAPMAGHIAKHQGEDEDTQTLVSLLEGDMPWYLLDSHELNRNGTARGKLVGGNLAVIADLISTPYDVFEPGAILFIEDVAEPVYKIERIMYQLKMSGALAKLGGLIVGKFTDYTPGVDGQTMEEMIAQMVKEYDYPVAMGVPVGHVSHNIPLPVSAPVTLIVRPGDTIIDFSGKE